MKAYAVGILREVEMGENIIQYLKGMDATLKPFGGQFIVHGARPELLEGSFSADFIVIEFPSLDKAKAWYQSSEYQAIVGFRTSSAKGDVFIIEGVDGKHKAMDILQIHC